eukprot:scaffold137_cov156-Skeletonema_menzelii.AAC.8
MVKVTLLTGVGAAACISSCFFATSATAQIYETSNDPDSLCISGSTKLTGYKATKDCRGYVYCNEGYLMGGGVIPCRPNQLFDESQKACTYWQDVDTSSSNCPEYDGSKLMPDQYDDNANEERFFCGHSWSHAKSICEPCPGGSRLECSDVGHTCFAGVTGCPSNAAALSNNNSVGNNSINSNLQATPVLTTIIQGQQQPSPAIVFVKPQTPTTTTASFSSSNNNECTIHSDCPSGKFCSEGFCGQCSKEGMGCSVDEVCRTTSCHVTQKSGPTKCYNKEEMHSFCRTAWKDESYQCNLDTMVCESSNFGLGGSVQVAPTQDPNTIVIKPESPLYTNPTGNNYFCGYSFSSLTSACLQSKPCPNGFASKYCAAEEGCFRSDQCAEEYEAASTALSASSVASASNESTAATNQQQQPTGSTNGLSQDVFANTSPSQTVVVLTPESPTNSWSNNFKQCISHDECTTGQFCNEAGDSYDDFFKLCYYLQQTGLYDVLNSDGTYTLFVHRNLLQIYLEVGYDNQQDNHEHPM